MVSDDFTIISPSELDFNLRDRVEVVLRYNPSIVGWKSLRHGKVSIEKWSLGVNET